MKKKKWYRAFSLADDKYIAEAHPSNKIKSTRNKVFVSIVAACACFALVICNLWLFVPFNTDPPDVSQYANSDYYGIIQKLNLLTFEKPKYKNNAEMLWTGLKSLAANISDGNKDTLGSVMSEAPTATGAYQEITDNQVEGIIEADRIKRSDTHIYYLDKNVLRVYLIDKEHTKEIGSYKLNNISDYFLGQCEFYLSSDCKTVTAITQYSKGSSEPYVELISLDVSNPKNIVKREEFSITGQYISSRNTNGVILLLTEFVINKQELDFNKETTFLPQIDDGNGPRSIPANEIISPENLNDTRYTVVMKLDEKTLDLEGTAAYLSYTEDVYVSENHIFLTHVFADELETANRAVIRNTMTDISCLAYGGDGFETKGKVTVRGYVKDQWSMDEYEGILRVFTTTNTQIISELFRGDTPPSASILRTATGQSNASLYCIDVSTFEILASVVDFAPPYEEIQSVRFDKELAYACTSIELSDPVFFFDLSNLNKITYKDTGTIEGFSTSLINLGNGYLLGIGRGNDWRSFKAEVYEETEKGVRSLSAFELDRVEYSTEYKSYYVDRENQLVGLGIIDHTTTEDANKYILLHFDGYELVKLVDESLKGDPQNMRGVYIDGYLYIFGEDDFKALKAFN